MERTETQTKVIRRWLEDGHSITPIDALNLCGCLRLAARIADLKELGLDISTEMIEQDGKRFARYTLK